MKNLGCFSVSLTVRNLAESKKFYESIGFDVFHGMEDQGWLIMKNGSCNIGLFQGMFDKNIMTFNPGWNQDAQRMDEFEDIRSLQEKFKNAGIEIQSEVQSESGPGSFTLIDPDGNPILFDQHV